MFNLYLVVSEDLQNYGDYYNPPDIYCIAELVVARNYSQARYLAWKTDYYFGDFIDMPKFQVRIKRKNVKGPARLVTNENNNALDDDGLWEL